MSNPPAIDAVHEALFGVRDDYVRQQFLARFEAEISDFEGIMAAAYERWREFESEFAKDQYSATVVGTLFMVQARMVVSMKLLIIGHLTMAGAAKRQVLEGIAAALLYSRKGLPYLKLAWEGRFSVDKALSLVVKKANQLGLNRTALATLVRAKGFYSKLSHPTLLAMGDLIDIRGSGAHYLGSSFDEGKLDFYRREIASRIGLAKILTNVIDATEMQMRAWPEFPAPQPMK